MSSIFGIHFLVTWLTLLRFIDSSSVRRVIFRITLDSTIDFFRFTCFYSCSPCNQRRREILSSQSAT